MLHIQDQSTIQHMRKNVENATMATMPQLMEELPSLVELAHSSKRELKLELLEVAASIVDKLVELAPEVTTDPGWPRYAEMRKKLADDIMHTRFAV